MAEQTLRGRVIVITGAGGGLGQVLAPAAAAAGAELILAGRRQKNLETTYDAVVAAGGPRPALFPIDFTKAGGDDYQRLADGVAADCGRLDGIVHLGARFNGLRPLSNLDLPDWQRTLHVNLTAPFAVTRACLPLLLAAPDASVIFAGDRVGRRPTAYWGGYAAAKAGLDVLLALFAAEHGYRENLRFNAVDPGPIATPLRRRAYPAGDPKARPPETALPPFLYLLGPESHGVNGQTLTAPEFAARGREKNKDKR